MSELPFELVVKPDSGAKDTESLTCTTLLRVVPGKREVYDALWKDHSVIVKVFLHKFRARYHLRKEWEGLKLLQAKGLSSPEPLFYGKTERGDCVVVLERIGDCSTVQDVVGGTIEGEEKLDLLFLVCKELARQHSKGVLQKDLHLGNFLLGGDKLFALDTGQMRFCPVGVSRKKAISQLALLAAYLPSSDLDTVKRLREEYAAVRGWHFSKAEETFFQKQISVHRKRGISKGLKKCLRTGTRYLRIKSGGHRGVFDKSFCEGGEAFDFAKQIDVLMDSGRILKDGNSSCVSQVKWNGAEVVIKRYNHKGLIHSLRHTVKRSRARRGWINAHRLGMLNIATPKPISFVERRKGPLVWTSYLITEYTKGTRLYDFLRDGNITEQEKEKRWEQVIGLINKMGSYGISHGDLKYSNVLITENGPVLTDLDSMKAHRFAWGCAIQLSKDLKRLQTDRRSIST